MNTSDLLHFPSEDRGLSESTTHTMSKTVLSELTALMRPAIPSEVFISYWKFAAERQRIFLRRLHGHPSPWTKDPILALYRFTNVYRATDRVSQFLIKCVQYNTDWSPEDLFFRTLLFKLFNKIETWETLVSTFGEPSIKKFSATAYGRKLNEVLEQGARIYSAAYIMPSGGSRSEYSRKHQMHLALLHAMVQDSLPKKIASAPNMEASYNILLQQPSIGPFLAYQFATDLNYSSLTDFDEMDFVKAGPGALEGIKKCFSTKGGLSPESIIRRTTGIQELAFSCLGLEFRGLSGRPLQLIDCQNLFCEIAKYARIRHPEFTEVGGRNRIKQKFSPRTTKVTIFFPPKWRTSIPEIE